MVSTLNGPKPIGVSRTSLEEDIFATSISPKICLASGYVHTPPVNRDGVDSLYVMLICLSPSTSIPEIVSAVPAWNSSIPTTLVKLES
ncbi:hypothetical protein D3C73_1497140 [compost metagenome]